MLQALPSSFLMIGESADSQVEFDIYLLNNMKDRKEKGTAPFIYKLYQLVQVYISLLRIQATSMLYPGQMILIHSLLRMSANSVQEFFLYFTNTVTFHLLFVS